MTAVRFAIIAAALESCGGAERAPSVHSESIGHLGHGYRKGSLIVSRDHRHLAWVKQIGNGCRVVVDRTKGPTFAYCGDPLFSPDGVTVAYWAAEETDQGPKAHLIVNGTPTATTFGRDGPIAFSKRGGAWAAIAPAYEPRPSKDATSGSQTDSAGPAAVGDSTPAERRLVAVDRGGVLGEYHDTTSPALSPDGAHVAYISADPAGVESLVVDGRVAQTFRKPPPSTLPAFKEAKPGPSLEPEASVIYLSDGSLVSVAAGEAGWVFRHGGDTWATYATPRFPKSGFDATDLHVLSQSAYLASSLVASQGVPVACWWERLEGGVERWRVACNGEPIDDQVCSFYVADVPIAVAGAKRAAAYACQINSSSEPEGTSEAPNNLWVVVGGKAIGPHRFVWGVDLSGDGNHYAYAAADTIEDPWFYVVDGKRYGGPWEQAFPPKLSPDGTTVVWAASRDAKGRRQDLVYDGRTVTRAELIMTPPIFQTNRQVEWAVKRGHTVRRVIVSG